MLCTYCQSENPDGSKFCLGCGKHIGQHCIRCKANLPAEARFCNECGHAVTPGEPSVASNPSDGELFALLNRGKRIDLRRALTDFEDQLIDTALRRTGGIKSQAADLLSINRTTLIEKLRHQRGQNQD